MRGEILTDNLAMYQIFKNYSDSTSAEMPHDKRRMAASVERGTAPKPVQVNAGANVRRPNSGNEIGRDSRRDGQFPAPLPKCNPVACIVGVFACFTLMLIAEWAIHFAFTHLK